VLATQTWYEIVLPPVMTFVVISGGLALLWLFRGRLRQLVRDVGIQRVSAFGVDVEFAERQAAAAYQKQRLPPPSEDDRAAIRDAATYLVPLAAGCRVLWVDEKPANNELERSTFVSWGIDVQSERRTEDGIRELSDPKQRFDLVISDWHRPGDQRDDPAGLDLVRRMGGLELKHLPRVIFYHGVVDDEELRSRRRRANDAGALGATGSPGELLRWALLELARVAIDAPRREQRERRERVAAMVSPRP
jgi:CheY-like chemotaxis protein